MLEIDAETAFLAELFVAAGTGRAPQRLGAGSTNVATSAM
jgi:hypothetical protein